MTKREPVAFDLVELSGMASAADDHSATRLVRRPIPSVPDNRLVGAAAAQAMSRMTSLAPDQGLQNRCYNSSRVTRPGVSRPLWMAERPQADSGSEDNSSITIDSSLKKEVTEGPSASAWDRSAHIINSLNRHEDFALAQQARKAAFVYGGPLQALRNVARTSAAGDEGQLGAHESSILLGTEPSSSHSAGSGSPVPLYSRMKGSCRFENGIQSPPPKQQQHPIQGVNVAAAGHALQRPPAPGKHPRTAQLTVFYAGMVNVYDDVPFDKAQAIMLLAGTGSAWSSNYTNFLGSCGANSGRPFPTPGEMNQPMSRADSPAPQLTTPSVGPPLGAVTKFPNRQVTTTVELPQARKASLARFLEKRKDRVRSKGPYTHPNDEAARNDELRRSSRENSPSHPYPSGKPPRRSLSPPAAGNQTNVGSEPSSPPQTPPRQRMSEERSHGMLARRECEKIKCGRHGSS